VVVLVSTSPAVISRSLLTSEMIVLRAENETFQWRVTQ
jgi:hypothetical protein